MKVEEGPLGKRKRIKGRMVGDTREMVWLQSKYVICRYE
jgi:hypothetical protein